MRTGTRLKMAPTYSLQGARPVVAFQLIRPVVVRRSTNALVRGTEARESEHPADVNSGCLMRRICKAIRPVPCSIQCSCLSRLCIGYGPMQVSPCRASELSRPGHVQARRSIPCTRSTSSERHRVSPLRGLMSKRCVVGVRLVSRDTAGKQIRVLI